MLELTLIRHGITAWNAQRRFQGHADTPLSEDGREQVRRLAARLAGEHIDAIFSSDLSRALETARAVAAPHGFDVRIDARLREFAFGTWDGLTWEEVVASRAHLDDSARAQAPDGGETFEQVHERVGAFLRELLAQTPNGHVAIVAHGGTIQTVLRELGLSTAGPPILHASITRIAIEAGRMARLISAGDVEHLDRGSRGIAFNAPPTMGPRTIMVNLDDTLNNFTEILQQGEFPYDPADSLPETTYENYLCKIRNGEPEPTNLFSTEYSLCRFKIHLQCWQQARARPEAVKFMRWLRLSQWRIVIYAQRDLRRANDCTRAWLQENDIPFDHLFMVADKIVFCKAWGIQHFVDHAAVNVYYSIVPAHQSLSDYSARTFQTFAEVKQWIQE